MSVGVAVRDYSTALEFLYERINYERTSQIPYCTAEFKLDRMHEFVRRLGDPQLRVPAVHIAGTKGKGSTAAMAAAILQRAGHRTGLYTSPHLERIEERFVIDGQVCSAQEFVELVRSVEPLVRELDDEASAAGLRGLTFFEITTAMALLHFAGRGVDIAVLEVGLGGRLDSTNVCRPLVCVITSISFDHTHQLGDTLAAIASEKAGIIKLGVPVVSGVLEEEPRRVIESIAERTRSPLRQRGCDFDSRLDASGRERHPLGGSIFSYTETSGGKTRTLSSLDLNLAGDHQVANAGLAIAAMGELARQGWDVPESAIRTGLTEVSCPGRVEIVRQQPTIVIDTAHNVASAAALVQTLSEVAGDSQKRVLVFATSRDKDAAGMLRLLLSAFDEIVLTQYRHNPRARSAPELTALAREALAELKSTLRPRLHESPDPHSAWQLARSLTEGADSLLCITGSFYLAAELRPVVLSEQPA